MAAVGEKLADKPRTLAQSLPWVEGPPGVLRHFKGHSRAVEALAVSRDGRWMVSGSADGTIYTWDLATGDQRHQLAPPGRAVISVAFILNDRYVVGSNGAKEIAVWDFRDGQLTNSLPAGKSYLASIAASPDGELVAWGLRPASNDNVLVWDAARRRGLRSLSCVGEARSLAFSPEGRRLLTGDTGRSLICWDLTTGSQLFHGTSEQPIMQVAFSPDGRHVATTSSQQIHIWDLIRGEVVHQPRTMAIRSNISFLADGIHLAATGLRHRVNIWDTRTGDKTQTAVVGDSTRVGDLRSLAALPDARAFVVGDSDGNIYLSARRGFIASSGFNPARPAALASRK